MKFAPRRSNNLLCEQLVAGPLLIPRPILVAGRIERENGEKISDGIYGGPAFPLMNFSMPIGERKPARAIMRGPGEVLPGCDIDAINEERVVVRIRMLIKGHPSHYRSADIRLLDILPVLLVEPSPAAPA